MVLPRHKLREEGSGMVPLLKFFCLPRTPGEHEYFIQFLRPQHDHDMLERTTTVTMFTRWLTNTGHVQWLACHHRAQSTHENIQAWVC